MAKISSNNQYVTVEKGDTLSEIALEFRQYSGGASYQTLASWNKIPNANLIYPGQKIYLKKDVASTASSVKTTGTMVTITQFGLKSDSNDTLFIAWYFGQTGKVEKYKVRWKCYYAGKWSGWTEYDTKEQYHTYTIPKDLENLSQVKAQVIPVAKEGSGLSGLNWSSTKTYFGGVLPETPTNLSVKMEGLTLTAEVTNVDSKIEQIVFQYAQDRVPFGSGIKMPIKANTSTYIWDVAAGHKYMVRCAAYANGMNGQWSDWSQEFDTIPSTPTISECKAVALADADGIAIQVTWSEVSSATGYKLQYATDKAYFDQTDKPVNIDPKDKCTWIVTGLSKGQRYYFRVAAYNSGGDSGWSEIKDIIVATKPAAPTVWSSSTVVGSYDPLTLYWMHNSEDNSKESVANLKIYIDTVEVVSEEIRKPESETENISSYKVKMVDEYGRALYPNGGELSWKVRTAGIANESSGDETSYGDWSENRIVQIYAQPTLDFSIMGADGKKLSTDRYCIVEQVHAGIYVKSDREVDIVSGYMIPGITTVDDEPIYHGEDAKGNEHDYCHDIRGLTSFPINIKAFVKETFVNQTPLAYRVSIAVETDGEHETVDEFGNTVPIISGTEVYSKQVNDPTLDISISAGDIQLENELTYVVTCTVTMSSSLTATESRTFDVSWEDDGVVPSADIYVDPDTISASIVPYCAYCVSEYRKVAYQNGKYTMTDQKIDGVTGGIPVENAIVETGEQVYFGSTSDGVNDYYCIFEELVRITDCILAVYRRECDGSFTELRSDIDGATSTTVIDPHPSLDYARYRIVSTSKSTGTVSYYDAAGIPVEEKSLIIQWDEPWSNFDTYNSDDTPVQLPGSGSMIKLPYNIDVSFKNDKDVSHVKYIGRKHPVSYHGTQLGESQTWNTVIDKTDKSTLYALRRLQSWAGNAYIREPSGSGYWATVVVSFSEKHSELTIPITFDITRVEGGV